MAARDRERIVRELRDALGAEFTTPALARFTGLNRGSITRAIKEKRLNARRVGRVWVVMPEDASDFIAARIDLRSRQLEEARGRRRQA